MDYQSLYALIPKRPTLWDSENVLTWLRFLHLENLIQRFRQKNIDGPMLKRIDHVYMKQQLKITSNITLKKLGRWISEGLKEFDEYLNTCSGIHTQLIEQAESQNQLCLQRQQTQKNDQRPKLIRSTSYRELLPNLIIKRIESIDIACYKFSTQKVMIGHCSKCNIIVEDENAQKFHTCIIYRQTDKKYLLKNLAHNYGTLLKITNKLKLHSDMMIQMGSNFFHVLLQGDQITFKVMNSDDEFTFRGCEKEKVTVGRKSTCDISFLTDSTLSGLHAKITFWKGEWNFQDLQTTNGSWLEITEEMEITTGLIFKIGTTAHIYECQLVQPLTPKIPPPKDRQLCYKCKKQSKNIVFNPCSHCVTCEACASGMKKCYLCEAAIDEKIKIFRV